MSKKSILSDPQKVKKHQNQENQLIILTQIDEKIQNLVFWKYRFFEIWKIQNRFLEKRHRFTGIFEIRTSKKTSKIRVDLIFLPSVSKWKMWWLFWKNIKNDQKSMSGMGRFQGNLEKWKNWKNHTTSKTWKSDLEIFKMWDGVWL